MKNSIRVSAKTIDDAITEAIIQLGVTSDQLDYEVIEQGSSGFLGIGMKQAVIEAKRKSSSPSYMEEMEKVSFKSDNLSKGKSDFKKSNKSKKKEKPYSKKSIDHKTESKVATREDLTVESKSTAKADSLEETNIKENEISFEITETTKNGVKTFMVDTLSAMNLDVEVSLSVDENNTLCIDLEGNNMGLIIGKRGQTLDSLQYLANRVANKYQSEYIRVKVDTENYRERRDETLVRLAKNLAHKVKRTRRPIALEPMNPYERRVIHSELQSHPFVKTHSEGDDPYRKVVITLKKRY